MAGFDLEEGKYFNYKVTEEELWKAFHLIFSTKTRNTTSYKFVFLKSIIDSLNLADNNLLLTFDQIFERFTEIYWILVIKYNICQGRAAEHRTYIEQILCGFVEEIGYEQFNIMFNDLPDYTKSIIIEKVKRKCKRYVIGALYNDSNGLLYSFSKKDEWIMINPQMYLFLQKHKDAIQELNYFELAKFIEGINTAFTVQRVRMKIKNGNSIEGLAVYRQMLYEEFEECNSVIYKDVKINTVEMLYGAEECYDKALKLEKENDRIISLSNKKNSFDEDTKSMMKYLGEPERVLKMLKLRKGIIRKV